MSIRDELITIMLTVEGYAPVRWVKTYDEGLEIKERHRALPTIDEAMTAAKRWARVSGIRYQEPA